MFQISEENLLKLLNYFLTWKKFTSFVNDSKSGKGFGAIINELLPGTCPDWNKWEDDLISNNLKDSIERAIKSLQWDILTDSDENYLYRFLFELVQMLPVFAFGPGLKQKILINENTKFFIFVAHIIKSEIDVKLVNPKMEEEEFIITSEDIDEQGNKIVSYMYSPMSEGDYQINLNYSGQTIGRSPYTITADKSESDLDKIFATGPGVEPTGIIVNKKTYFNIFTAVGGTGSVDCVILDPRSRRTNVIPHITQEDEYKYLVEYTPIEIGLHSVNVFFSGHQIPFSPFGVTVESDMDPNLVSARGRGIQKTGIRVGDKVYFVVNTKEAGNGELSINISNSDNESIATKITNEEDGIFRCYYEPKKQGMHRIEIKFGNEDIPFSPFEINIKQFSEIQMQAFGPGLKSGIVNQECLFIVETNDEDGALSFAIKGPSETTIKCIDNDDGSATVTYSPLVDGEYAIHVMCDEEDIPNSPYVVEILVNSNSYNSSEIDIIYENEDCHVNIEETLKIHCKKPISKSMISVECLSVNGLNVPTKLRESVENNISFVCTFTFTEWGKYWLFVSYSGVNISEVSPFLINVLEPPIPENVKIYGPCLEEVVRNRETYFIIDCENAGAGDVELCILDEKDCDIEFDIEDYLDGRIQITFAPSTAGPVYTVQVYYAGVEVPQSPILLNIKPEIDLSKLSVQNLKLKVYKESYESFTVNIKEVPEYETMTLFIKILNPNGKPVDSTMRLVENGVFKCLYSPVVEGLHHIFLFCNDVLFSEKPFEVHVIKGFDSKQVRVFGEGLNNGYLKECLEFIVDLEGAGQGGLGIFIEGPKTTDLHCQDNNDGTCLIKYYPLEEGTYKIFVTFHDESISGSPFIVSLKDTTIGKSVKCSGTGLSSPVILNTLSDFIVDTSEEAELFPFKVEISTVTTETILEPKIVEKNRVFNVSYLPTKLEKHQIKVFYGDQSIIGSPFMVDVSLRFDINKVLVEGDGITSLLEGQYASDKIKQFVINTSQPGHCQVIVEIKGPSKEIPVVNVISQSESLYTCQYKTAFAGNYSILVTCNGLHVKNSPFSITILEENKKAETENKVLKEMSSISIIDEESEKIEENSSHNLQCVPIITINDFSLHEDKSLDTEYEDTLNCSLNTTNAELADCLMNDNDINSAKGNPLTSKNEEEYNNVISLTSDHEEDELNQINYSTGPFMPEEMGETDETNGVELFDNYENINSDSVSDKKVFILTPTDFDVNKNSSNSDETLVVKNKLNDTNQEENENIHENVEGKMNSLNNIIESKNQIKEDSTIPNVIKHESPRDETSDETDNIKNKKEIIEKIPTKPISEEVGIDKVEMAIPNEEIPNSNLKPINLEYYVGYKPINIKADITDFNNTIIKPNITFKDEEMILDLNFQPITSGNHEIMIICDDSPLSKAPYLFHVDENNVFDQIRAFGDGLYFSAVNNWSYFTIDASNIALNWISVVFRGPRLCSMNIFENKDGTYNVNYMTHIDGTYYAHISYLNREIHGSPFTITSQRELNKFSTFKIKAVHEIYINPTQSSLKMLYVLVVTPNNEKHIWYCTKSLNGYLGVLLKPEIEGKYLLTPYFGKKRISNKIYGLVIETHDLPNAEKVIVKDEKETFNVEEWNVIKIDISNAGYGELEFRMEGPGKVKIESQNDEVGCFLINFTANIPGIYVVSIFFANDIVPNFPKLFKAISKDVNLFCSSLEGIVSTMERDSKVEIVNIDWPLKGLCPTQNMIAKIKSPSGQVLYTDIIDYDDSHFNIRFTPTETGEHCVSVKQGNIHVPGSPFKIFVGDVESGQRKDIQVFGMGIEGGYVDVKNAFSIYIKDGGSGKLTVSIDGPSKAAIDLTEKENGAYDVEYKISVIGEYFCSIKFNNEHVPGSPFKMILQNRSSEESIYSKNVHNITLASVQNQGVPIGRSTSFTLSQSGLNSSLMRAYMVTPSLKTESVKIKSIGNEQFSLRMEPKEKGLHMIYVLLDEKPIPGSPFEVMVGDVVAFGKGLIEAKVGETSSFKLDTKNAELGALTVTMDGPSKVELNCFELDDGYEFTYCPSVPGNHILAVKYKNIHVQGSPFKILVTGEKQVQTMHSTIKTQKYHSLNTSPVSGQSFPENVKCRGEGLSKAYFGRNNQFIVDASSGGAGVLYVGINGPSKPCEEINIKHIGGKRFQVNYFVQEFGNHLILIRWNDKEIAGSPFPVFVQ